MSEELGADFWDERYGGEELPPWELEGPAPPLVRFSGTDRFPLSAPGKVLVPGCGAGHDAAHFARSGFEVLGVDVAPKAIGIARQNYPHENLKFERLDFFQPETNHLECFDLMVEHTFFCAIHPKLRDEYGLMVGRYLKPGGYLLGVYWNHDRGPGGPPYDSPPDVVIGHLERHLKLIHREKCSDSHERRANEEWLMLFQKPSS